MDALCPLVESGTDTIHDRLTLGAILRTFLPALLHLLKLGNHKLRVLRHLAACGTPVLGANLFACPHCRHRARWLSLLYSKRWVLYAKRPFGGPQRHSARATNIGPQQAPSVR